MIERDLGFVTLDRTSSEWFVPLRKALGLESFGINLLVMQPGMRGRVHIHERQDEVYVVLEGELTVQLEAEAYRLGPDDVMRVGLAVRRQLVNEGDEPVVVLALGGSGTHESRDALAWTDWAEEGPGRSPREVPLPG